MEQFDTFIRSLSASLVRHSDGDWRAPENAVISYPHEASGFFAAIEESSYWFAHRNLCILSILRRFPPRGPVIDVGGGNGFVSLALKKDGIPAIVLEPGPGADVARSRGLTVIRASLSSAQFREQSVSAFAMFDVLEHIDDDHGALHEICRTLSHGGFLYLTVPAFRWLWSGEDVNVGHARRYTARSLAKVFRSSGLELVFSTYIFRPLVLPIFCLRSLPSLFGLLPSRGNSKKSDYVLPSGLSGRLLWQMLVNELNALRSGECLSWGSSLVAVGKKIQ